MIGRRQPMRAVYKRNEGATAVEFGIIAPVLMLFLMGVMDFGHWVYVRSIAVGALEGVARSAGVGGAAVVPATFQTDVENQHAAPAATFVWDPRSYYQFSGVGKPEKLITDVDGDGSYDAGDCWQDLNPNLTYDTAPGRAGVGGADDILFYKVTVTFPPLISLGGFMPGLDTDHVSTLTTIVRRQPYAAQPTPAIRC
jgi:Flp pilus assembly pilin Flp